MAHSLELRPAKAFEFGSSGPTWPDQDHAAIIQTRTDPAPAGMLRGAATGYDSAPIHLNAALSGGFKDDKERHIARQVTAFTVISL